MKTNTRKEKRTLYFADLANRNKSGFIYNVQVLTYGILDYINYLKEHPEDLKLTMATGVTVNNNGTSCRIIVCRDQNEMDRLMKMGDEWFVTNLWQEQQTITTKSTTIAKSEDGNQTSKHETA